MRRWRNWAWTAVFHSAARNRRSSRKAGPRRPPPAGNGCGSRSRAKRIVKWTTREIRRGGVSYTIETLRDFVKRFPQAQLFYLIGADNAAKLNEWREAGELAKLSNLSRFRGRRCDGEFSAAVSRTKAQGFSAGRVLVEIRARVKAGLPIDHLVPPPVAEAIRNSRLYT